MKNVLEQGKNGKSKEMETLCDEISDILIKAKKPPSHLMAQQKKVFHFGKRTEINWLKSHLTKGKG